MHWNQQQNQSIDVFCVICLVNRATLEWKVDLHDYHEQLLEIYYTVDKLLFTQF